jgi:hypothetical protein
MGVKDRVNYQNAEKVAIQRAKVSDFCGDAAKSRRFCHFFTGTLLTRDKEFLPHPTAFRRGR